MTLDTNMFPIHFSRALCRSCNAMLGQLAVRVLTYCPDVPPDDVASLLGRARSAVDAAAVEVECFVEDVVAAAVKGNGLCIWCVSATRDLLLIMIMLHVSSPKTRCASRPPQDN
jgi:hypothetical protein